jgi:heme/copper-type cytochrome/quinol oxidase subunit 3
MHMADMAVLKCEWSMAKTGMLTSIALGLVALALQVYMWSRFDFSWHSHVYGSYIWFLLFLHTAHIIGSVTESVVLTILPLRGYKNDSVRQGLNVDEIYWYFVVVSAIFVYAIVFYAPRFL